MELLTNRFRSETTENKVCFLLPLKIMPEDKKLKFEPSSTDHQHL